MAIQAGSRLIASLIRWMLNATVLSVTIPRSQDFKSLTAPYLASDKAEPEKGYDAKAAAWKTTNSGSEVTSK